MVHIPGQRNADYKNLFLNSEFNNKTTSVNDKEFQLDGKQCRMSESTEQTKQGGDEKQKRIKQRGTSHGVMIAVVVVALIICVGVGVAIGTARGGSDESSRSTSTAGSSGRMSEEAKQCFVNNNITQQSDRYNEIRSVIQSAENSPSLQLTSRNAHLSFCWLTHDDPFRLEDVKGKDYQLIQRFVLVLIYFHFSGHKDTVDTARASMLSTSNWLTHLPICEWDFLACDSRAGGDDIVTGLLLSSKGLTGSMPTELALLTKLSHLEMSINFLTGRIPTELWTMTQLEVFVSGINELTGTFPTELSRLTRLRQIDFSSSLYAGTLPDLSALTHMEKLYLTVNPRVSGPFPNISNWRNLEQLQLSCINLEGPIPEYIGQLSKLYYIRLHMTSLSGAIPSELGQLLNLESLWLTEGSFSGNIPSELAGLTRLRKLNLERLGFLSGTIPSEFGRLSSLGKMRLPCFLHLLASSLSLITAIAIPFGLVESLELLGTEYLEGKMPSEICSLRETSLQVLTVECGSVDCECCTRCEI